MVQQLISANVSLAGLWVEDWCGTYTDVSTGSVQVQCVVLLLMPPVFLRLSLRLQLRLVIETTIMSAIDVIETTIVIVIMSV